MTLDFRGQVTRALLIGTLITGSGLLVRAMSPQEVGTWRLLDASPDSRVGAASVVLGDGRVLFAGGTFAGTATDTVLAFNPADGSRTMVGHMVASRVDPTATLLPDGRVLIAGGRVDGVISADLEIFDPVSGSSAVIASLAQPRTGHSAASLSDGRVLLVGGTGPDGVLDTAELFDQAAGTAVPAGVHMTSPRSGASASLLLDGRVLIAGGNDGQQDLASAEIFDPWTQVFVQTSTSLSVGRSGHTALLLPGNNSVLIAGGTANGVPQQAVDLFLPAQFPDPYSYGMGAFAAAAPLNQPRARAVSAPLGDGAAFVAGGGAPDAEAFRFVTLKTDRDDYAPGHAAVITGAGWQPDTDVTLLFQEDPAVHADYELHVKADAAGNIYWDQWAPETHDLNVRFYLLATQATATGERRAQITFTDSTNVSTSTALNDLPSTVTGGQANLAFSGDVSVRSGDPAPPAGGVVTLQMRPGTSCTGSMTALVTVGTNAAGHFSGTFTAPSTAGQYSYRVEYQGLQGTGGSSTNWQKSASACQTLTVNAQASTALNVAPAAGTYGAPVSLTATLTSNASAVTGKSIAFTLNGISVGTATTNANGVASLTGVSLAGIDAGLYVAGVTASFAGDASYLSSSNTASLTVSRASQAALTVNVPSPAVFDQVYTLTTSGGSGAGGVSFSVGSSDACTVGADKLTITLGSGGTCAVTATKAADTNFDEAVSASTPVTLARASQATVSLSAPANATYGQTGLVAVASGGSGSGLLSYSAGSSTACSVDASSGAITVLSGSGTCSLTAARGGDANYADSASSAPATVTVQRATLTVTPDGSKSKTYGQTFTAFTGSVQGLVNGDSGTATYSSTGASAVASVGSYDITSAFTFTAGNADNYDIQANTTAGGLAVNKARVTATAGSGVGVYDGDSHAPSACVVAGAFTGDLTCTNAPATVGPDAGTTAIAPVVNGTGLSNFDVTAVNGSYTIEQAVSVTTLTCPASVTYTGSAQTPCSAAVSGAGGLQQAVPVSYSNNLNAGTAQASASFAGDANHQASGDATSFTIEQAVSVTTVTCPASVTYTGSAQTPCSAAVSGAGGLQQAVTVSYSNNLNAGTAQASASFAGDANHQASGDATSFTIAPAASVTTVTCPPTAVYTGLAVEPCSGRVTGAGGLNASLAVTYAKNITAGVADASATFGGDRNHLPSADSETFVIGFNVCALYDQTKAVKQNATVPVKFFLCDVSGRDVSSASIVVNAVSLAPTAGSLSGVVDDAGGANPDNNFRFDPTLGPAGGYIFNLSTKGLGPAIWNLSFTVGGQTFSTYHLAFGVK